MTMSPAVVNISDKPLPIPQEIGGSIDQAIRVSQGGRHGFIRGLETRGFWLALGSFHELPDATQSNPAAWNPGINFRKSQKICGRT
jgi:hypothetical protein